MDLATLLRHAAQFHAEHDQDDPSSSTRPSQKIDDQYLRFLWKILIKQEGVVVGRVIRNKKPNKQLTVQATPQPDVPDATPDGGQPTTPSGKGKERETPIAAGGATPSLPPDDADPRDSQNGDEEEIVLDAEGLPPRKRVKGAPAGMKGKQVAPTNNRGDLFELLPPDEYVNVKLDDLKEKYDDLRIALDSEKMFFVLTGSHPGVSPPRPLL